MADASRVNELISRWQAYRGEIPEPRRYEILAGDLYKLRNNKGGAYRADLVDPDDEVMASVEHYFLCRDWVGNGKYPAWQVEHMVAIYRLGKDIGLAPRHNPLRPVTPNSPVQRKFQELGIEHGRHDLKRFNVDAPVLPSIPPYYYY